MKVFIFLFFGCFVSLAYAADYFDGKLSVDIEIKDNEVYISIDSSFGGFAAFGFGTTGMDGADIIVLYRDNDEVKILDMHAVGHSPTQDTTDGGTSDYTIVSSSQSASSLQAVVKRSSLSPNDEYDFEFPSSGSINIIYSVHESSNDLIYHTQRDTSSLKLTVSSTSTPTDSVEEDNQSNGNSDSTDSGEEDNQSNGNSDSTDQTEEDAPSNTNSDLTSSTEDGNQSDEINSEIDDQYYSDNHKDTDIIIFNNSYNSYTVLNDVGNHTFLKMLQGNLNVSISVIAEEIFFFVSSNYLGFAAIGFGSSIMLDTDIIFLYRNNSQVMLKDLYCNASHRPPLEDTLQGGTSDYELVNFTLTDSTMSATVKRNSLTSNDKYDYNFSSNERISLIYAVHKESNELKFHSERGSQIITIQRSEAASTLTKCQKILTIFYLFICWMFILFFQ